MTKYILHGGETKEINADNDSFFREITTNTKGRISILLNYFAREDSEIERLFKRDKQRILQNSQNKNIEFEVARPETFIEQLNKAEILYISGGTTSKLVEEMSKHSHLDDSLRQSNCWLIRWCLCPLKILLRKRYQ